MPFFGHRSPQECIYDPRLERRNRDTLSECRSRYTNSSDRTKSHCFEAGILQHGNARAKGRLARFFSTPPLPVCRSSTPVSHDHIIWTRARLNVGVRSGVLIARPYPTPALRFRSGIAGSSTEEGHDGPWEFWTKVNVSLRPNAAPFGPEELADEKEAFFRGTDCRGVEAGRGRSACGRSDS